MLGACADQFQSHHLLVANRWPFRLHATYDDSISRFLNVFEEIDRELPFNGLRWFFDHAETISEQSMERVRNLEGGSPSRTAWPSRGNTS